MATASRNMRELHSAACWCKPRGTGNERDHEGRQVLGDFRIGLEIGQASRRRNFLAGFDLRLGPVFKSRGRVQHRLIERVTRRDAARQIRKPNARQPCLLHLRRWQHTGSYAGSVFCPDCTSLNFAEQFLAQIHFHTSFRIAKNMMLAFDLEESSSFALVAALARTACHIGSRLRRFGNPLGSQVLERLVDATFGRAVILINCVRHAN